jgi:hypothetical protein
MPLLEASHRHIGPPISTPKWMLAVLLTAWAIAVVGASGMLLRYEQTPGAGDGGRRWPAGAPITLDGRKLTVVVVVHPRCPCTRATLHAIRDLVEEYPDAAGFHFALFCPANAGDEWTQSPNAQLAALVRGADLCKDTDGELCRLLGASTSGTVMVFDHSGANLFTGGVTPSRGHEGDNPGLDALRQLLSGEPLAVRSTPVFGCSIVGFSDLVCSDSECSSK